MKEKIKIILQKQMEDVNKTSNASALILSVCLIDVMACLFNGFVGQKRVNKKFFVLFCKKYLQQFDAEELYKIRCDIVHNFANSLQLCFIDSPSFTMAFPNLKSFLKNKLFKIDVLRTELSNALENYFKDLNQDAVLLNNFNKSINHLELIKDAIIPTTTDLNGKIVSHVNELPELIPGSGIRIGVYNPTIGFK